MRIGAEGAVLPEGADRCWTETSDQGMLTRLDPKLVTQRMLIGAKTEPPVHSTDYAGWTEVLMGTGCNPEAMFIQLEKLSEHQLCVWHCSGY